MQNSLVLADMLCPQLLRTLKGMSKQGEITIFYPHENEAYITLATEMAERGYSAISIDY
jgi:hypothetical protein